MFFQWKLGNHRPVGSHNGHLPIRKPELEHAICPKLVGNLPGSFACRLHIREIKPALGNGGRVI
jgi:hypothetical protein